MRIDFTEDAFDSFKETLNSLQGRSVNVHTPLASYGPATILIAEDDVLRFDDAGTGETHAVSYDGLEVEVL